ncbi:MAG: hypothetical protein AAF798_21945 [Bacteroidota bacterium]
MKYSILLLFSTILFTNTFAQSYDLKKPVTAAEVIYLQQTIHAIAESDQRYRKFISANTLDETVIDKMDAVYEADGIEAYMKYCASLNLQLEQSIKDSLWNLQHQIDLANHLALRGIFETYGFLPESMLPEKHYVQLIILLHPPKDWNIPNYLSDYSQLLQAEVEAGRMEAKTFATFYDNIKVKILREPQLYGTNQVFDVSTNSVQPPSIVSIEATNEAREELGLKPLKEGEYRLIAK